MLTKVLIANRGAIACRIIRTLKKLGIGSVAVYHQQDQHSLHVQQADEAVCLGEGPVTATYLNQGRILAIARQTGANAIHPGYGFLSENPDFASACSAAGIYFLGPRPEHMTAFGLKHSARTLAEQNSVPLLPGTELLTDLTAARNAAKHIGYPVMLKSTAGGGGIGMQLCYSDQELSGAWDSVKRLSANNFANDGVFLEKFVEKARHIEVQVFGDGNGNVITLGERDCSLQRRNQKVLEETPAPGLTDVQRQQLQTTARRLTAAVNYQSAGTVEFIFDAANGQFYFLEVNTRLQVEHGVTEEVYGVDLVEWMVRLPGVQAGKDNLHLDQYQATLQPVGHAIQARIYAEDPVLDFQPSAGLLSRVEWPAAVEQGRLRIDTWVESGTTIPALFDPMLAKIIVTADSRAQALAGLSQALASSELYGIETNRAYLRDILADQRVNNGDVYTQLLKTLHHAPLTLQVIAAGTQTTIQDLPARIGYWDIGVPPSGPFDSYSFELGNRLLGNATQDAGLEITLKGPILKFNTTTRVLLAGAHTQAKITHVNGVIEIPEFWKPISVQAGDILDTGAVSGAGARAYLLIDGGLQCPDYLGSKSTFTLGQFGGHNGRALLPGDVLHLQSASTHAINPPLNPAIDALLPAITHEWQLRVIYGPHGAPEFFTESDIERLFENTYEIHYNSSRTGVRLIGPKPEWARTDGGEAGLHPSNIHDNAYAIGTIDFTGDMPVILGPDGPSLGGFVCPATVISADLWKLGQLKAGDKVTFIPVSQTTAVELFNQQAANLVSLTAANAVTVEDYRPASPVVAKISTDNHPTGVIYRPSGDRYLLVEYGPLQLDIRLRFRVHALMQYLQSQPINGLQELTPGIRSLQLHYDSTVLPQDQLLDLLLAAEDQLGDLEGAEVPSRIVHLPLSWDDEVCRLAAEKYMQSVRADAPWCPDNIEFIRRINGLDSIQDVKDIVFNASYLVMGLGDVYLGAPVATPVDPRHRLVTTKYNPARTWTAENSVGIGGAYMCIYGMEGPGGYQFVGRTLQMWNRYKQTREFTQPWLLRFFDQVRFYAVSHDELIDIRQQFPHGQYPIRIEETTFNLSQYEAFLAQQSSGISAFQRERQKAFQHELEDWKRTGRFNYDSEPAATEQKDERPLADGEFSVESHIAGNVWQCLVKPGDLVAANQPLLILESMKMEIEVSSHQAGTVVEVVKQAGQGVAPGSLLVVLMKN